MGISLCMYACIVLCILFMCVCMHVCVSVMKAAMCVFYAVIPFLVNADITTKLDKISTISRCIDNDNLHAKNVWQMPPVPPIVCSIRFRNFVHLSH